jgi:hypothetical protein
MTNDMMARLQKTREPKPPIAVVYGVGGVGKTTFGANAPSPIFIQTEDGLTSPALTNIPSFGLMRSFAEVMSALDTIAQHHKEQGWGTIVIDSIEGLDPLIRAHVCDKNAWGRIEDGAYGAGKSAYREEWNEFVQAIISLRNYTNMGIIIIGHTKTVPVTPPDGQQYNRYGFTLAPDIGEIIVDNSDMVLFATRPKTVVQQDKGFGNKVGRVVGSSDPVLFTSDEGWCLGKNRFNLPTPHIPLNFDAVAPYVPAWAPYAKAPKEAAE